MYWLAFCEQTWPCEVLCRNDIFLLSCKYFRHYSNLMQEIVHCLILGKISIVYPVVGLLSNLLQMNTWYNKIHLLHMNYRPIIWPNCLRIRFVLPLESLKLDTSFWQEFVIFFADVCRDCLSYRPAFLFLLLDRLFRKILWFDSGIKFPMLLHHSRYRGRLDVSWILWDHE